MSAARLSVWRDVHGVAHWALLKRELDDPWLTDVFTACEGYLPDALAYNEDDMVTCVTCATSSFATHVEGMNLDVIGHLSESGLLEHLVDNDAMASGFEP